MNNFNLKQNTVEYLELRVKELEQEKEQLLERLRISETDRFYGKPNTRENRR